MNPFPHRHGGWIRASLLAGWIVGLAGGCAWRLPPEPAADLRRTLDLVAHMEDSREKNAILTEALHARVEEFQSLVERNILLRERILREANRLEQAFSQKHDLEPADLKLVSEGATRYLKLRDELLALVDRYQFLMAYSEEDLLHHGVDPRLRLVAVMVSVGAALTLYDNYLTTVLRFERSTGLRRFVNHGDRSAGLDRRTMEKIGQSARSIINRGQLRGALMSYEEWRQKYPDWKTRFQPDPDQLDVLDQDFTYLETLIRSSVSFEFVAGVHPARLSAMKLETLSRTLPDLLHDSGEQFIQGLSRIFVEGIGLVETRKGLLDGSAEKHATVLAHLNSILKAGDILLEKAPFRLADRTVPGYWGHAAIWLGTVQELVALDLWDDPRLTAPRSFKGIDVRHSIESGRSVIEAVRGGVTLNTLDHFLNVDDLAVLRPAMNQDPARRPEQREAIVTALTHLGKNYDFGFDVLTRDRIVCSELAFQSYTQPEFHWPTANLMGRYTISPDQIARRAIRNDEVKPPLSLIVFYHKGELMNASRSELELMMSHLLKVKEHEKAYQRRAVPARKHSRSGANQPDEGWPAFLINQFARASGDAGQMVTQEGGE